MLVLLFLNSWIITVWDLDVLKRMCRDQRTTVCVEWVLLPYTIAGSQGLPGAGLEARQSPLRAHLSPTPSVLGAFGSTQGLVQHLPFCKPS